MQIPRGGIAFFDSGIGGLTVLEDCLRFFDKGIFYYLGDNKHAPYGNLPYRKIRRYVFRAFRTFRRLQVKAVVVACNTATAVCIEDLRRKYRFPIIGAEPAVFAASARGGRVAVLATRATCESNRLRMLCQRARALYQNAEISVHSCDGLAGEIEKHFGDAQYDYSMHLPKLEADGIVLGCTHYIYIVGQIQGYYRCPVYHGNRGIAMRLYALFNPEQDCCVKNRDFRPPKRRFLTKLGCVTTFFKNRVKKGGRKGKGYRGRKLSCVKNDNALNLIFLGNSKGNNRKQCEQMFVNYGYNYEMDESGFLVVKNPKKFGKI